MSDFFLDDPDDDLEDDEDDELHDEDDDENDENDDEEDDEEVETWQVSKSIPFPLKIRPFLTSRPEVPRLARISSSTGLDAGLAGSRPDGVSHA